MTPAGNSRDAGNSLSRPQNSNCSKLITRFKISARIGPGRIKPEVEKVVANVIVMLCIDNGTLDGRRNMLTDGGEQSFPIGHPDTSRREAGQYITKFPINFNFATDVGFSESQRGSLQNASHL